MLGYVILMAAFALHLIHPQLLWSLFHLRARREGERPSAVYLVLSRVIAVLALVALGVLFYLQLAG